MHTVASTVVRLACVSSIFAYTLSLKIIGAFSIARQFYTIFYRFCMACNLKREETRLFLLFWKRSTSVALRSWLRESHRLLLPWLSKAFVIISSKHNGISIKICLIINKLICFQFVLFWCKVRIFWEGHKIWKNLPLKIWRYSNVKFQVEDFFFKFVAFSVYPNFLK